MTRKTSPWLTLVGIGAAAFGAVGGCDRDVMIGRELPALTGNGGAQPDARSPTPPDARTDAASDATKPGCEVAECAKQRYECGDCVDNDGDGLVDMEDPDCLGPCQNSEKAFFGTIPGQNHAACDQDCYFDQDSGSGNDGCSWSHHCDPLESAPDYPPEGPKCAYDPKTQVPQRGTCTTASQQSAQCKTVCGPLTPNGCDCFGCCLFAGAPNAVWLGSTDAQGNGTCDLAHVRDPSRCRPCTPVADCVNPCDPCELCAGKQDVPVSCQQGNGTCNSDRCVIGTPCGAGCPTPCPAGKACVTGCCIDPPR